MNGGANNTRHSKPSQNTPQQQQQQQTNKSPTHSWVTSWQHVVDSSVAAVGKATLIIVLVVLSLLQRPPLLVLRIFFHLSVWQAGGRSGAGHCASVSCVGSQPISSREGKEKTKTEAKKDCNVAA